MEQWSTGAGTALSDIYSLGMTLGEMIAGNRFDIAHAGAGIRHDLVSGPHSQGTAAINRALRTMTALAPSQRQASMRIVIRELMVAANAR